MRDLIQEIFIVALGLLVALAIVLGAIAIRRARSTQKRLNDYVKAMNAVNQANGKKKKKRHLWIVPAFIAPVAATKNHPIVMGTVAAGSIGTLLLVAPMVTDENTLSRPPPITAAVPTLEDSSSTIEPTAATAQGTQPSAQAGITTRLDELGTRLPLPTKLPVEQSTLPTVPTKLPQPTLPHSLPSPTKLPSLPSPTKLQLSPLPLPTKLPIPKYPPLQFPDSHENEGRSNGMGRFAG